MQVVATLKARSLNMNIIIITATNCDLLRVDKRVAPDREGAVDKQCQGEGKL